MVLSLLRVCASQERYGGYWLVLQGLSRSLTACVWKVFGDKSLPSTPIGPLPYGTRPIGLRRRTSDNCGPCMLSETHAMSPYLTLTLQCLLYFSFSFLTLCKVPATPNQCLPGHFKGF